MLPIFLINNHITRIKGKKEVFLKQKPHYRNKKKNSILSNILKDLETIQKGCFVYKMKMLSNNYVCTVHIWDVFFPLYTLAMSSILKWFRYKQNINMHNDISLIIIYIILSFSKDLFCMHLWHFLCRFFFTFIFFLDRLLIHYIYRPYKEMWLNYHN